VDKYIFLDIDGVIATPETVEEGTWGLTKSKQELLGKILSETGAKIVLSSSWRHNDLQNTIDYMSDKGFLFCDKLVGVTLRLYKYIDREQKIHLSIPRGLEIDQWIDTHVHSNNGKDWNRKKIGRDFTYVILDDDADMLLEQKNYFIHTDVMIGLTEIEAQSAVGILNFKTDLTDEPSHEEQN
jgi:hypothetical protein